jgi:acyl-coenzyme A synthetase/AMP-(fatty) acid ligase/acyl carrier protein
MSHRALYNLLCWQLATMVPPRAARLLQYASLSFDVSFQEIFPTLSAGGCILVISETLRRDPPGLLRTISRHRVEKFYLPVVALQQLAAAAEVVPDADLDCMREITAAGEQLRITPQIVRFFQRARHCTLHNFYGPTETHGTTLYTLRGDPQTWPTLVPIGQPIANDQNYVLDRRGELQPLGVCGELYLGGVGLADGYAGRPDLTAARFVPDPFGPHPGGRLYRTGDLARWRPDGLIEFLGRIDHQVKVRGFRVELEEIEAVLAAHPGVRECVVALREDVPGDRRLVAYLVTRPGERPGVSQLRTQVQQRLPEYMIPASYVFLDQLPLTLNRKVDRSRLPAPDEQRPELETQYLAPRTPTEEAIAGIWAELLTLERVGVQDNFFELGGHSLLVTQVVSRLRSHFGIEIAIVDLFTAATIEQLAARIDELLLAQVDTADIDSMLTLLDGMDEAEAERMLKQLDAAT